MADTSYEFLTDFFINYLPFTPTAGQVDTFKRDLSLVSPYLMAASLKEVKAGTLGNVLVYRPSEWRPAIFQVYNRKVAEHAQLFPVFHSFETAFRSTVAVKIENYYNHKRWWRGVYSALRKGDAPHTVKTVGHENLTRDAADTIARIIRSIDGEDLGGALVPAMDNGFQFVECADLSHIGQLIERHWSVFGPIFTRGSQRLPVAEFRAKFTRVREARNDIYHHKSVARMSNVVSTAEDLLDYLNFSLGFVCKKIQDAKPTPSAFVIPQETRHQTW